MPSLRLDNAYLLLAATSLFWAGNAIAGQLAVDHVSPFLLVFLRWLMVSSALGIFHARQLVATWPVIRERRLSVILMATLGFTGFNALFYVASHHTSGINIGILQGSIPMIVLVGAAIAYGSRIRPLQLLGVLATLAGTVVVASRGELSNLIALQFASGDVLMLAACVLYAGYTVALKRRPAIPGLVFLTWLSIVAVLASAPLALIEAIQGKTLWPTEQGWLVTLYVTIFPSFLAQIFFIRGVEKIGPERAGVFVNLVPVFAALLAVALLGEHFQIFHAIALSLVLGGIWLSERTKPLEPDMGGRRLK